MRSPSNRVWVALAAALLLLCGSPALALERGITVDGRPYLMGGIGLQEREELAAARNDFSLRIATAARGSGAFVSNVQVRILDAGDRIVFERELAGPVLLVDLAPGRYGLEATLDGQTQRTRTQIGAQDRREVIFCFDVAVEVLARDEAGL
jgi:hypothetical protein